MAWISRQSKLLCWSNKILQWLHFSLPVCLKRTPSTRLVRAEAVGFPIINLCCCFVKRLYVRSCSLLNAHSNNHVVDCRDGGNWLVIPCFFVTPFHNFIGVQLLLSYLIQYHLIDKGRKLSWEYNHTKASYKGIWSHIKFFNCWCGMRIDPAVCTKRWTQVLDSD